jgi:hypothetical protein
MAAVRLQPSGAPADTGPAQQPLYDLYGVFGRKMLGLHAVLHRPTGP